MRSLEFQGVKREGESSHCIILNYWFSIKLVLIRLVYALRFAFYSISIQFYQKNLEYVSCFLISMLSHSISRHCCCLRKIRVKRCDLALSGHEFEKH